MASGSFVTKTHSASGKRILAACDPELLGRTLEHGDMSFEVSRAFYGETEERGESVIDMIRESDITNVVGKEIVDLLVREKMVDERCILWIGDVPHVQLVTM